MDADRGGNSITDELPGKHNKAGSVATNTLTAKPNLNNKPLKNIDWLRTLVKIATESREACIKGAAYQLKHINYLNLSFDNE